MEEKLIRKNSSFLGALLKWFAAVMTLIYLALGLWLIVTAKQALIFTYERALIIGVISIGYGMYRGFLTYKKYFSHKIDENV